MEKLRELEKQKKIAIFGWPATGKSTFAEFLSNKLEIPIYSLDILRWKNAENGKKDTTKFLEEYTEILEKEQWIIEGNALDYILPRLEKADLIFFFDSTVEESIKNYQEREKRIANKLEQRKGFDTTKTTLDTTQWIRNRYASKIDKLRLLLQNYTYKLIIVNNYRELDFLIDEIKKDK